MSLGMWVVVMTLVMLALEVLAGRHRNIYSAGDVKVAGGCVLMSVVTRPLVAYLIALVIGTLLPSYRGALVDAPILPTFIAFLLIGEFTFYWVHRWAHQRRNKILYGMHLTHHTAAYMNVLVQLRTNAFWPFVQPYTWVVALAFYLCSPWAGAALMIGLQAWGIITHSNFRWDEAIAKRGALGAAAVHGLEWLLVTPRLHHAHHGYGKDGKTGRNFGVILSVFDRIFNTLHIPEQRPQYYGVRESGPHWVQQILFPLVNIKSAVREQPVAAIDRKPDAG